MAYVAEEWTRKDQTMKMRHPLGMMLCQCGMNKIQETQPPTLRRLRYSKADRFSRPPLIYDVHVNLSEKLSKDRHSL